MKILSSNEIGFVCGGGAGDIKITLGDGTPVKVEGFLSDYADAAVKYSKVAPLSGIGLIGLAIRVLG
ncbi:hypothetical protein [Pseudoxanthomonas putridarboris]|uniref:Uncharacterized protein n=1 Tax=Pseudoxanthomonas putridarboris TaxID=752605 RepID=A0ABU9J2N9_9GAMM